MFTYFCPRCISIETHFGSLLSLCGFCHRQWSVAIAFNGRPCKGSQLAFIPDRKKD